MQNKITELLKQTSGIFLDKEEAVKLSTVCLLAGGHLLIEDVPGVGKTTLVQTLGQLLGLKTNRIQFTIDLLPGDILGGHIYDPRDHEFHFHPGPLFAELILADELNRASPRTQSALLQAMEEGQVSLDGKTWNLPKPFFVIATQNPHQNLGTFPLPESQLDRFMISLELNFASKNTEIEIFKNKNPRDKIGALKALFTAAELLEIQNMIENKRIKNIRLFTSLECVGPQAEYMRRGLNYQLFLQNINTFLEIVPSGYLSFMTTYNVLTVPYFKDFLKLIVELRQKWGDRILLDIAHLKEPPHWTMNILPKKFGVYMIDCADFMKGNNCFTETEINKMERVRDYFYNDSHAITEEYRKNARKDFGKFFPEYDRRSNLNFAKTFPELQEFLQDCVRESNE